ncbi:MAG: hypothetical protein AAF721_01810 [Myxococcota bacterium]
MSIPFHRLAARQRRMLLEMLASERCGEDALHIGRFFGRDVTADGLCTQGLAVRLTPEALVFTDFGRHIAERLATEIVLRSRAARLAS